jgi:hypothetical protein
MHFPELPYLSKTILCLVYVSHHKADWRTSRMFPGAGVSYTRDNNEPGGNPCFLWDNEKKE